MPDLLVVVDDVSQVISAAVVRFSHAHTVVRKVDIAVVAEEFGHREGARTWLMKRFKGSCDGLEGVARFRRSSIMKDGDDDAADVRVGEGSLK